VLLRFSSGEGRVRPYIVAGPTAGYRTRARVRGRDEDKIVDEDADDIFTDADFGLSAGAGLLFPRGRSSVFVEGRYTHGLIDVAKDDPDDPPATHTDLKTRTIQVLVGVTFRLGGR
jgi:hypothetical protein